MTKTNNNVILLTGANSGIGYECAKTLLNNNHKVIGVDYNDDKMLRLAQEYHDNFYPVKKDLKIDISSFPDFISNLTTQFGALKALICCAGISDIRPLRNLDAEKIQNLMSINFLAPLFLAKGFCKKGNNTGHGSKIIVISSAASIKNDKGQIGYSASKAALTASFRCLAREVARQGICVNIISPVDVKTPMMEQLNMLRDFNIDNYPLGLMEPMDVVNFILFLLSDKTNRISCQNYILDSGVL